MRGGRNKEGAGRAQFWVLGVLLACSTILAQAQVYRCQDDSGKVEYKDQPCVQASGAERREPVGAAAGRREIPLIADPARADADPRLSLPLRLQGSSSAQDLLRLARGSEVHVVAGARPKSFETRVVVHRPGQKVFLVLASEYRVKWVIERTSGTEITGVIVSNDKGGQSPVRFQVDQFGLPQAAGSSQQDLQVHRVALNGLDVPDFTLTPLWRQQLKQLVGVERPSALRAADELDEDVHLYKVDDAQLLRQRAAPLQNLKEVALVPVDRVPPRSLAQGAEVMMVAGREGPRNGTSRVVLDRPGKAVVLALFSEKPVNWRLEVSVGTELRGVLLATRAGKSELRGPASLVVYAVAAQDSEWNSVLFRRQLEFLQRSFGVETLAAVRTTIPELIEFYRIEHQRGDLTLAGARAEEQVPLIEFPLTDTQYRVLRWTNQGPKTDEAAARQDPLHYGGVVFTGAGRQRFDIEREGLREYDAQGRPVAMPAMPPGWPSMAHLRDIAYDSHRGILSISLLARLIRYDVRHRRWLDHQFLTVPVDLLTYDAMAQRYVGWSGAGTVVLLSPDGKLLREIRLGHLLADYAIVREMQLSRHGLTPIGYGDYIVLAHIMGSTTTHIWTYNLKTGRAMLTYKESRGK